MTLAGIIIRHRKAIVILWVIAIVLSIPIFKKLDEILVYEEESFLPPTAESAIANKILKEEFREAPPTPYYLLIITKLNTSDHRYQELYKEFKNKVFQRNLVKKFTSYYEFLNDTKEIAHKMLYNIVTNLHNATLMLKNMLELMNMTYNILYNNITMLPKFMNQLYNYTLTFDKMYVGMYENFSQISRTYNSLGEYLKQIDNAFNQTLYLVLFINTTSSYITLLNNTYSEIYIKVVNFSKPIAIIRYLISEVDDSYSRLYNSLSQLRESLISSYKGVLELNSFIYELPYYYIVTYFNITRTHYYMLNAFNYSAPLFILDELVKLTNVSSIDPTLGPINKSLALYLYYEVKVKNRFGDPKNVDEYDLNVLTKELLQALISKHVPKEYRDIVKIYLSTIASEWSSFIDEFIKKGGILKWYVYDKENLTNTWISQINVYYKLNSVYENLLKTSFNNSKNDIAETLAVKFNIPLELALNIVNIALDIGFPANETRAKELIIDLFAKILSEKIKEPSINYKELVRHIWKHGVSPELALNLTRIITYKYIDELEIPEEFISKEEIKNKLLPLIFSVIAEADPDAKGLLTTDPNLKKHTIYVVVTLMDILNIKLPRELAEVDIYDLMTSIYDYLVKKDDKIIRSMIRNLMLNFVEKEVPKEYIPIASKLVDLTCTLWPVNASKELEIIETCVNFMVNVTKAEISINITPIMLKYYPLIKEAEVIKELRNISWNILLNLMEEVNETAPTLLAILKSPNVFSFKIRDILVDRGLWLHDVEDEVKEAFKELLIDTLMKYKVHGIILNKDTIVKAVNLIIANETLNASRLILSEVFRKLPVEYNITSIIRYLINQKPGFTSNKSRVKELIIDIFLDEFSSRFKDVVSKNTIAFTLNVVYGPEELPRSSISHELSSNLTYILLEEIITNTLKKANVTNETTICELLAKIRGKLPITKSQLKHIVIQEILTQVTEFVKGTDVEKYITSLVNDVYGLKENATKHDYDAIILKYLNSIVEDILEESKELLGVLVSDDNDTMLIAIETYENPESDEAFNKVLMVRKIAKEIFEKKALCKVYLTGPQPLLTDVAEHARKDRELVDRLSPILVTIVLFVVLGGILALIMPMVGIISSIIISSAIIYLVISKITDIHIWSRIIMITTALGLGVDYSTYLMSRFKEELAKGKTREEAAEIALSKSAPAILAAATTDMAGFGILAVAWDFPFLRSLGVTIPIAILMVMLAGLTLIPSILAMIGSSKAFWWPRGIKPLREVKKSSFIQKVARRAGIVILVFIVISLTSAYTYVKLFRPSHEYSIALPMGAESSQGLELLKRELKPGILAPVYVILELKVNATKNETLHLIEEISRYIDLLPYTTIVYGPTRPNGTLLESVNVETVRKMGGLRYIAGNKVLLKVALNASPDSDYATTALRELRRDLKELINKEYSDIISHVYVGGFTATLVDLDITLEETFWHKILPIAFIAMFILLTLTLRTVIGSAIAVILIGSAILWGVALTTVTFKVLLGIPIIWFLPIMVFSIILGVGMDYLSFYMVRAMEESRNRSMDEALAIAGGAVSRIIIGLALIVCGAYAALLAADMMLLREIGFALTSSIFIISILTSYTVLPAILSKLGKKAWWPRKIS